MMHPSNAAIRAGANNYAGAVKNLNKVEHELGGLNVPSVARTASWTISWPPAHRQTPVLA